MNKYEMYLVNQKKPIMPGLMTVSEIYDYAVAHRATFARGGWPVTEIIHWVTRRLFHGPEIAGIKVIPYSSRYPGSWCWMIVYPDGAIEV